MALMANPREIRVTRPLGMGLDEKTIEAVRNWRFEPVRRDGRPVAVEIAVTVSFSMDNGRRQKPGIVGKDSTRSAASARCLDLCRILPTVFFKS